MLTDKGSYMKNLILLISLASMHIYAGTCTSISRTNYTSGQVLTSSSLNSQLNTVYSAANALDGGCVTDGTLEDGALNTTDFETLLKAPQMGCLVSYSSANAVSISKCYAAVNGAYVQKSTATTVTMGCTGCSADSASTTYYVYIQTGSSGSTLTGLLTTTAPNADGYDNSGNKVLARLYNNASSDISQFSIDQWITNRFVPTNIGDQAYTPTGTWTTNTTYTGRFRREGQNMRVQIKIALAGAPGVPGTTAFQVDIPTGYLIDTGQILDTNFHVVGQGAYGDSGGATYRMFAVYVDTNTIAAYVFKTDNTYGETAQLTNTVPVTPASGDIAILNFMVPIVGWNN